MDSPIARPWAPNKGAVPCPECGQPCRPLSIKVRGYCHRCATMRGDYWQATLERRLSRIQYRERARQNYKTPEQLIAEHVKELQAGNMGPPGLEFDDTEAGRAWKKLASSGRGSRPRRGCGGA